MSKKSTSFDLDKTIERRAHQVLELLLSRGKSTALPAGYRDLSQANKFAQAARSWCNRRPETGSHRSRGRALHHMWSRVSELCAQVV